MNESILPPVSASPDLIAHLAADEVINFLRISSRQRLHRPVSQFLEKTVYRLALRLTRFDARIGEIGLQQATRELLSEFFHHWQFEGTANIPASGPVLITSNHPGGADFVALVASINRPDLRILSSDRPIFRALPNVSRHLIYLPRPPFHIDRMAAMQTVIQALKDGMAVFLFPNGKWEADPDILPEARQNLQNWSKSIGIFLNKVPETVLQPVLVRGILNHEVLRHPLTWLASTPLNRQNIAVVLQTLRQRIQPSSWPVNVHVRFGEPQPADSPRFSPGSPSLV